MTTEAWLAFAHISAILAWVVFATSQSALCRADWLNAAAVQRLRRLDALLWAASAAVLLSGLARVYWGVKGAAWYWGNPLLHIKLTLLALVLLLQALNSRRFAQWAAQAAQGALPGASAVQAARRNALAATHLFALLPLPAVFMARGFAL